MFKSGPTFSNFWNDRRSSFDVSFIDAIGFLTIYAKNYCEMTLNDVQSLKSCLGD